MLFCICLFQNFLFLNIDNYMFSSTKKMFLFCSFTLYLSIKSVIFDTLKVPKHFVESITLNRIDYNHDEKVSDEVNSIICNL